MKVAAIIAEYDPFHNGHAYHIAETKKAGFDRVVVILGGNLTQRGEISVIPKDVKCKAALLAGADLAVELPAPYVCASAQRFAFGGAEIAAALGCVDAVSFGSECGDVTKLKTAADMLDDTAVDADIPEFLKEGCSYPVARQKAFEKHFGAEIASVLTNPNDILAAEYIKALSAHPEIGVFTVKRACGYGEKAVCGDKASASYIRNLYSEGKFKEAEAFVPDYAVSLYHEAFEKGIFPCSFEKISSAVLAKLRIMSQNDFASLSDVSEGLENRLYAAARNSSTLDELYFNVKTKRYTLARIRRIVLNAFFGTDPALCRAMPPYIRVLGFKDSGEEILKSMKISATLPFSSSLSELSQISPLAKAFAENESRCTDIFALSMPHPRDCGEEYRYKLIKI